MPQYWHRQSRSRTSRLGRTAAKMCIRDSYHASEKEAHVYANHTLALDELSEEAAAIPAVDVCMEQAHDRAEAIHRSVRKGYAKTISFCMIFQNIHYQITVRIGFSLPVHFLEITVLF